MEYAAGDKVNLNISLRRLYDLNACQLMRITHALLSKS
jgi:hypothetical protein